MNNINTNNGLLMELKTVQLSAFKTMTEALKESLKDGTFKITPPTYDEEGKMTDSCGVILTAINQSTSVLIKLKLLGMKFEKYYVKSNIPIKITINMSCFYKLIKTINNDDQMLTLFIDERDPNHLGIKIENLEKKMSTTYKLIILDSGTKDLQIPDSEYDAFVIMSSDRFQTIIRNMSVICDTVNISFIDSPTIRDTLIFYGKGEFASQRTVLQANENINTVAPENEIIIQGVYDLRNLGLFSKCSNLCQNVELYMKRDYPIILKYQIANLGFAHLILTPKVANDDDKSESEEETTE